MTQAERLSLGRIERRPWKRRIPKRNTKDAENEISQKTPYEDLIDFLSSSVQSGSLKAGAEYGRLLVNAVSFMESQKSPDKTLPDPAGLPQEVVNEFLQHNLIGSQIDATDGTHITEQLVRYSSKDNQDVVDHILKIPNRYFRMGATLSLNLSEFAKERQVEAENLNRRAA